MKSRYYFLQYIVILFFIYILSSCGVSRIVSTEAKYIQHGDTITNIVTKSTTNYDAKTSIPITNFIK